MMETTGTQDKINYPSHAMKWLSQPNQLPVDDVFKTCEHALRFASPILPLLAHDCRNSLERGATFPSLASRTWPILNLRFALLKQNVVFGSTCVEWTRPSL
jgi:hypothetical protein